MSTDESPIIGDREIHSIGKAGLVSLNTQGWHVQNIRWGLVGTGCPDLVRVPLEAAKSLDRVPVRQDPVRQIKAFIWEVGSTKSIRSSKDVRRLPVYLCLRERSSRWRDKSRPAPEGYRSI